jgi:hypothetical protein
VFSFLLERSTYFLEGTQTSRYWPLYCLPSWEAFLLGRLSFLFGFYISLHFGQQWTIICSISIVWRCSCLLQSPF